MKPLGNISLVWSFPPKADVKRTRQVYVGSRHNGRQQIRRLRIVNRGPRLVDIGLIGNLVTVGRHGGIGEASSRLSLPCEQNTQTG